MPNWCNNNLVITGDKTERDKFVQQAQVPTEQLEKKRQAYDILGQLYPTPQELVEVGSGFSNDPDVQAERERKQLENISKYGEKDWYDWNIANWGTKWGDCETFLDTNEEDMTVFSFQSAWSPPVEGLTHISTLFPTLTFVLTYDESGMGFFGAMKVRNGESMIEEREFDSIPNISDVDWDDDDSINAYHEAIDRAKDALYSLVL